MDENDYSNLLLKVITEFHDDFERIFKEKGKVPVYNFFNVVEEGVYHISVLLIDLSCLIYGNGYSDEMIFLLSKEVEFWKFNRYYFNGSKQIIDSLFKLNNAVYKLDVHRNIYRCQKVNPAFNYASGKLQMGDKRRLDELASLSQAFSKAYDGTEMDLEKCKRLIWDGIINDNFYQWNDNNKICSIAQTINGEQHDFPVIGHFYTNPLFRNKGFGASLIHSLTTGLLKNGNDFVMLVADATNTASNKVFINVGYEKTGEYLRGYKEA